MDDMTAPPPKNESQNIRPADSSARQCHRLKVATPVSGTFWLQFCAVGGGGNASSIFITNTILILQLFHRGAFPVLITASANGALPAFFCVTLKAFHRKPLRGF